MQQIQSNVGASTLAMLDSPEPASFESFLIPLINEIANFQEDCVLVIDDYHLIAARPIHEALTFLLEHLPPQLHLAIASRIEPPLPLARLRACGHLTELRTGNLRFTVAETTSFINQSMKLHLLKEQVEEIFARTEGWIAGLQLAVLFLRDAQDISTFIESLRGNQRYILDYLVEEVLEQVSEYHRRAAHWYEKQGFATEAIGHTIAAQEFHGQQS